MFDGPAFWRLIHFFAIHDKGRVVLQNLKDFIGCETCKASYVPPTDTENLLEWSVQLHNSINVKLGKSVVDVPSIKTTCDLCDHSSDHIWTCIHNIAETGKDTSIPILHLINEEYPCNVCNRNLFIDTILPAEHPLYWTLRNHTRMNNERGYPPFAYVMDPPSSNEITACAGCPSAV